MVNKGRKILIVDDNVINRMILSEMLGERYELLEAEDGEEAIAILEGRSDEIALMLLDIVMPKMDGFGVLEIMNRRHWIEDIQVIMISSETDPEIIGRAYDLGVTDFVPRPFHPAVVRRRIENAMVMWLKQRQLMEMVEEQTLSRERDNNIMISILSHIVEFRNGESGRHILNIMSITGTLLSALQHKTDKYSEIVSDANVIKLASALHDIGKITIDEAILNKPGRLTAEEFEIMKTHSAAGADIVSKLEEYKNEPVVKYAYQICRWHHERWGGRGYPDGLAGDEIPIAAQIVSLADVYDALTSVRCYKPAYSHEKTLEMITNGECGEFNPVLIECLLEVGDSLKAKLESNDIIPSGDSKAIAWSMLHKA